MTNHYLLPLPEADEYGTPKTKMPNCPHCGEDELGLIQPDCAVCYRCQSLVSRIDPGKSITDQLLRCGDCPWIGRLAATEPGDDGELHCPQCLEEIVVKTPEPT